MALSKEVMEHLLRFQSLQIKSLQNEVIDKQKIIRELRTEIKERGEIINRRFGQYDRNRYMSEYYTEMAERNKAMATPSLWTAIKETIASFWGKTK